MKFIDHLVDWSVTHRWLTIFATLGFILLGLWSFSATRFDAFPDLTNTQVQVLTSSPGMGSEEVELLVTRPIERALGGTPHVAELRSLSRTGISAITIVFEDGTDLWLARQLVKERLDAARGDIPDSAGAPEVAPPATGLGEVYQFTLASDRHTSYELHRIFERDVAPRLRNIDGVVEVNAWGGGSPELHVKIDPFRLSAVGLRLQEVKEALQQAIGIVAGGAKLEGDEQRLVRGVSNPNNPAALSKLVLRPASEEQGAAVLLEDVARVEEGGALTTGLGTADGEGEVMFVVVQLLSGADALGVVQEVSKRVEELRESIPEGVVLEMIYDREKLVGSTLDTVSNSLLEGGILVIIVLFLLLGDLRAGLLVASVIPLSMLGAFIGLNALGISGNLMSLGAVDFGIIVDPTIVVVEGVVALSLGRSGYFGKDIVKRTGSLARPVLFATGVLILVYLPILLMVGTEGKLFRPMAVTVLLALSTALLLSFTYVPAMASFVLKPRGDHQPPATRFVRWLYKPLLGLSMRLPIPALALALCILGGSGFLLSNLGIEFIPRLEEGDMVIQTTRLPSLTPEVAMLEATRIERIVKTFPEVERIASRTGAPGLATDPMGLEEADMLIRLAPRDQWTTADNIDGLVDAISKKIEAEAPGAELTFTQPIEMRFNEMLEGVTSDVGVIVYGADLDVLMQIAQDLAAELETIPGAADVTPPIMEGVPGLDIELNPEKLALHGLTAEDVLPLISTLQRGQVVGDVIRGAFQDEVVLKLDIPDSLPLEDIPITLPGGRSIPLGEVATIKEVLKPTTIERESGSRRVVIEANVRGRDIGSFVQEAQAKLAKYDLPDGYWMGWSGKYEQLRSAANRLLILIPIVLLLIGAVLHAALKSWRLAWLIFLNVPIAVSGGVIALWVRNLPLSMSAVVGFVALFGVAVMNGIVLLSRVQELRVEKSAFDAAQEGALERLRPVLMTASTDAIGFLPMAIAVGVGAEVQRPLATVVIGGLVTSTVLTLLVLPALYARFGGSQGPSAEGLAKGTPSDEAPSDEIPSAEALIPSEV